MSRLIMPSILNQGVAGGKYFLASENGGKLYHYNSISWSDVSPVASAANYRECSISDDGKKWIIPIASGRLWLWDGASYVEQRPAGNVDKNWIAAAISGDGNKMIAAVYGGRAYFYNGSNWIEIQPAGNVDKNWGGLSLNYTGSLLGIGIQGGRLYFGDGSTFTEQRPSGNIDLTWSNIKFCKDGTKAIACAAYNRVYLYDGSNWIEIQPDGNTNIAWQQVGIDKNGIKFLSTTQFGGSSGKMYFFDGTNWAIDLPRVGYSKRTFAAMSGNADVFIQAGYGDRLYIKKNGVWVEHQPAGDSNRNWYSVTVNRGTN